MAAGGVFSVIFGVVASSGRKHVARNGVFASDVCLRGEHP